MVAMRLEFPQAMAFCRLSPDCLVRGPGEIWNDEPIA